MCKSCASQSPGSNTCCAAQVQGALVSCISIIDGKETGIFQSEICSSFMAVLAVGDVANYAMWIMYSAQFIFHACLTCVKCSSCLCQLCRRRLCFTPSVSVCLFVNEASQKHRDAVYETFCGLRRSDYLWS